MIVESNQSIPLPVEENRNGQVVVYAHYKFNNTWAPVLLCSLEDAITLHHKAQIYDGYDLFIFLPDSKPSNFKLK